MTEEAAREPSAPEKLMEAMFGGEDQLRKDVKKGLYRGMSEHLLTTLGLISFKMVTSLIAQSRIMHLDDPDERVVALRNHKETLRQKIMNEWMAVAPTIAMDNFKKNPESLPVFTDGELMEMINESLADVETWSRGALDMTPTAEELMGSYGFPTEEHDAPEDEEINNDE